MNLGRKFTTHTSKLHPGGGDEGEMAGRTGPLSLISPSLSPEAPTRCTPSTTPCNLAFPRLRGHSLSQMLSHPFDLANLLSTTLCLTSEFFLARRQVPIPPISANRAAHSGWCIGSTEEQGAEETACLSQEPGMPQITLEQSSWGRRQCPHLTPQQPLCTMGYDW